MISLNNICVSFADFVLLDNVGLTVGPKDRVALVGRNGAGKSTLLKIMAKIQQPTTGDVVLPKDLKVGYLPQQMGHAKDKTVMEEAMTVFSCIGETRARIEDLTSRLAERTDYESAAYHRIIEELNAANETLALWSGDNPMGNAQKTLTGLGFRPTDFDRPTAEFSEGWNMRIELAKILLSRPQLLLLDEPTNHLDIESLQWLESYLETYTGAMVVISHDRAFLDNVTRRTVEVIFGRIHDYKASYSHYLELRKERIAQQMAAYENQQRMIEKTEEFIARFRYKPTKSNQVQSRIKALEKIERITIDKEDNSGLVIKFPPVARAGQVVFQTKNLAVGYDGVRPVFSGADLLVERGEKVAFVGRNGEGKTTMMRVLTGALGAMEGEAKLGYNVNLGYYAQTQEGILRDEDTVYETLDRVAVGDIRTKLRDLLAAFLFKGEDVDKKVAVLSGGERSRLAMARLMLQPYNVLALDEPTNHMDIRSKEVIKQALQQFEGTLVVVSHDRVFLDGLVSKVYEFRDGGVREHLGGIRAFLERRRIEHLRELERKDPDDPEKNALSSKKIEAKLSYEAKKQLDREARKLQKRIDELEKSIAMHEQGIALMDKQLATPKPEGYAPAFYQVYEKERKALESDMEAWAEAQEAYEIFCKENDYQ